MGRMDGPAIPFWGKDAMTSQKERPANVPEENVYKSIHWMVILTYVVAISGVTILLVNAG